MGRGVKTSKRTTIKKHIWKMAIYIRLSKEDGNNESKSIQHQRQMIIDYLKWFDEPFEIVDVYIDDGCTGTDTEREGFQNMLATIYQYKINCVIVKDLSRLSRNLADSTFHV